VTDEDEYSHHVDQRSSHELGDKQIRRRERSAPTYRDSTVILPEMYPGRGKPESASSPG
jgi:hypothetical protein